MALSPPSYVVFFGFGSTELSLQARRTIAQFASDYLRLHASDNALLYAHSDAAEASEALAQARGEAVRMYLAELGVPSDRATIFAYGGTRPLVITKPNVREPQNRRVELVFSDFSLPRSSP